MQRPGAEAAYSENPYLQNEYAANTRGVEENIFRFQMQQESLKAIDPGFMGGQPAMLPNNRALLIDWLVQIHEYMRYAPQTHFLTVLHLDRYFALQTLENFDELQLTGAAVFFLVSKIEEIHPIAVQDLVFLSEQTFTPE